MRPFCCVGVALLACNIAAFPESKIPCNQTFSHPLHPSAVLIIDSSSAGLQIVGADQKAIHVSCTAGSEEIAREVTFHFSPSAKGGKLSIDVAHLQHGDNSLEVRIEVPRRTNLGIRMFAGEVTVEEVKGDKDIELKAGQITISSIHGGDYGRVDASVGIGDVQARAFGVDKGGFFQSFSKTNPSGDYRLRTHVATGEIDLLGNAETKSEGANPD